MDANTARGTPAGSCQIIDPTWQRYGAIAAIDLKPYPTAMSAPRNLQAQVASAIPVDQWGPNTVNALKAKYPGIDTSQTLGAVQSAVLNGGSSFQEPRPDRTLSIIPAAARPPPPRMCPHSPAIPATPGTTINSTPVAAPHASARASRRSSPRT